VLVRPAGTGCAFVAIARSGHITNAGGAVFFGEYAEFIVFHAEGKGFGTLGVGVFQTAGFTEGELHAGNAHGIGLQDVFPTVDRLLNGMECGISNAILQGKQGALNGISHQFGVSCRILGKQYVRSGLDDLFEEAVNDNAVGMRISLIVGVDHKYNVLIGNTDAKLAAHAIEKDAVVVGAPDLVTIAEGGGKGEAQFAGIHQIGGGFPDIVFAEKLLAVPLTAI